MCYGLSAMKCRSFTKSTLALVALHFTQYSHCSESSREHLCQIARRSWGLLKRYSVDDYDQVCGLITLLSLDHTYFNLVLFLWLNVITMISEAKTSSRWRPDASEQESGARKLACQGIGWLSMRRSDPLWPDVARTASMGLQVPRQVNLYHPKFQNRGHQV